MQTDPSYRLPPRVIVYSPAAIMSVLRLVPPDYVACAANPLDTQRYSLTNVSPHIWGATSNYRQYFVFATIFCRKIDVGYKIMYTVNESFGYFCP